MNGVTPTVVLFCIGVVFASGGAFWAIDSVGDRVTKVEEEVILRPEFDAVVKGIEQGQKTLEKGQDDIKKDVKNIERMIQQHYSVGEDH